MLQPALTCRRWLNMNAEYPFGNQDAPASIALPVIDVGAWHGHTAPPRPWIVDGWLPSRALTLLAGKGGTGKSLLVQQWLSCLSTGNLFMGVCGVTPVKCLYVNCEDPADELWRRQEAIARAAGRQMKSYEGCLFISPRLGEPDNSLGNFTDRGAFSKSELLDAIRHTARAHDCRVIALDNVAHLYTGNENVRGEVTAFCNALSALALEIDGAVILVAHPAKSDESEFSGSTAWENAVRNRLFLDRPEDGDGNELENRRTLSRNKSNLASIGDKLKMVWHAGAFYPPGAVEAETGREAMAEAAFLACLDTATEQRRNVSHSPGKNYAPTVFATMPQAAGIGSRSLEMAMARLFTSGEIVANQELWRHERRRAPVHGIARTNARTTPAPTPAPTVHNPRTTPAPTRTQTPLYTTYITGGASEPPAGNDIDFDAGNWVPDYAPDENPPELEPWL